MAKSVKIDSAGYYLDADEPTMTAEEAMKDEEDVKVVPADNMTVKEVVGKYWAVAIKLLELFICAASLGFIYDPVATTDLGKGFGNTHVMHHIGIMYTTYCGFMVINCALLLSKALNKKIPYITVSIFALVGAGLNMITCILLFMDRLYLIRYYHYSPHMDRLILMTTALVFTLLNVFVYGIDAIFTLVRKEDF